MENKSKKEAVLVISDKTVRESYEMLKKISPTPQEEMEWHRDYITFCKRYNKERIGNLKKIKLDRSKNGKQNARS
jgi:hypothetical protein